MPLSDSSGGSAARQVAMRQEKIWNATQKNHSSTGKQQMHMENMPNLAIISSALQEGIVVENTAYNILEGREER